MSTTTEPTRASLPEQPISQEVLLEKYAKGDERTVHDVRARVARALAAVEAPAQRALWERRFLDAQRRGFVPAGRINSAALRFIPAEKLTEEGYGEYASLFQAQPPQQQQQQKPKEL